jgi:hypothetical protein
MADKKISALTSASTPLAGTEVLPIVQSSTTVKVATNDLTVRNIRANATTGILQITGPADASTRVVTIPNANWIAARTDTAQSFTGDQTLSTGNLIVSTSGKGIDFSANTGAAGMTSELLKWYEEGTWTPAPTNLTVVGTPTYTGKYTRIGRQVTCIACIDSTTSTTATAGSTSFGGLPFASVAIAGNNSGNGTTVDANTVTQVGSGYIFTANNRFYVTGWTATANIVMSFTYFV